MDAHIVLSTRQNTVNAIPLLMKRFGGRTPLILSSSYATKNHWTANLAFVLKKHGLKPRVLDISKCENDNRALRKYIVDQTSEFSSVLFNISGGKKNQILPLLSAYVLRKNAQDRMLYTDSNPFRIEVYKGLEQVDEHPPEYLLDLEDISNLYGYTCCQTPKKVSHTRVDPDNLILPADRLRKINRAFTENYDIAKLMYKYFDKRPSELDEKTGIEDKIKKVLNEHKPELEECDLAKKDELRRRCDRLFDIARELKTRDKSDGRPPTEGELRNLWKKISTYPQKKELFNRYWSLIRKAIVHYIQESIDIQNPVLFHSASYAKNIIKKCNEISGGNHPLMEKIRWSDVKELLGFDAKKGFIFENMLAIKMHDLIREKESSALSRLYMNVRAYRLEYQETGEAYVADRNENENVVEFDLVFVTDHGTIYSFEAKTFGHEGDILKSKSYSTSSQGGVFSETIMVTQIQEQHIQDEEEFSDYIPQGVLSQLEGLKRYIPKIWYYDQIEENIDSILK